MPGYAPVHPLKQALAAVALTIGCSAQADLELLPDDLDEGGSPIVRYDFAGTGAEVMDRAGSAHARVLGGARLDGSGRLTLDGDDDYVDLPNGLLSRLSSATIVVWYEWLGGTCWQRLFDFGSTQQGEDEAGDALTALFYTPLACGSERSLAAFELGARRATVYGASGVSSTRRMQVALVFDGARGRLSLYQDGVAMGEASVAASLRELDEFRIYGRALTGAEIRGIALRGPDWP